ncbi:MAG: cation transporter [Negativicutes bacterium]|nr:cation transporter [Negativicutes bacterium]
MKKTYRLEGLNCASCAAKIERAVNGLDGVTSATLNFMTTKLVIEADEAKLSEIAAAAEKIVKKIEPDVKLKKFD